MEKLSIIIPCYNEAKSLLQVLDKVSSTSLPLHVEREIILVDDRSTDGTAAIAASYAAGKKGITFHQHEHNQGKGACIHTALKICTGSIVVIQDADLEYDPKDYTLLLQPILDGHADVVFGSRFRGSGPHRVLFFFHTIGNKLLTFLSNLFTQLNLTDMETGYKMFRKEVLDQIQLKEKRFGFEPEVTAKISRVSRVRIYEVGVSYYGRTYEEGKKITWRDGFKTIYCIFKYNLFARK